MTATIDSPRPDLFPPGEYIRDELETRGWTQEDLAAILGRPLSAVNQIIKGNKAITPQTARELAAAFGTSAELWLNLENAYRLGLSRQETAEVSKRARLYELAPLKEMIRRGWIPPHEDADDLELAVLAFFEIRSIDEKPRMNHAASKSSSYAGTTPRQLAWYFRAKHLAATQKVRRFDEARLRQRLPHVRGLAATVEDLAKLPELLAEMGIRFVLVEQLQGSRIDGATLWIDDASPVIALSLRFDRIDGFWHTLAHELMHVLHRQTAIDIDMIQKDSRSASPKPAVEDQIDREASRFLIPPKEIQAFIGHFGDRIPKHGITNFARHLGVHPGVVVGQLHFRQSMPYTHCRGMLVGVREWLAPAATTDGWA